MVEIPSTAAIPSANLTASKFAYFTVGYLDISVAGERLGEFPSLVASPDREPLPVLSVRAIAT